MPNVAWMAVARRQSGVVSRVQLRSTGLTDDQVDHLVRTGQLSPMGRGTFRSAAAPATLDGSLWRAVLATGGVLVGSSAAHLWQLIPEPPDVVQVAVDRQRQVFPLAGVTVSRLDLATHELTRRLGLPVTTRTRSALDHIAGCGFSAAVAFADRAVAQRWITSRDLERRLESPRRGNAQVRRVLRTLVVGAEAESERRMHTLLRRAGIHGWSPNHVVAAGARFIARVDIAFAAQRLAIEIDGFAYHSDRDRFQRDRRRQNELVNAGWTVLRFTWTDLVDRPEYVLSTIQAHLQRMEDSPHLVR